MITELTRTVPQWAGALFTGIFQGFLLAAIVWAWLRWEKRSSATTRYVVLFMSLIWVTILPLLHLVGFYFNTTSGYTEFKEQTAAQHAVNQIENNFEDRVHQNLSSSQWVESDSNFNPPQHDVEIPLSTPEPVLEFKKDPLNLAGPNSIEGEVVSIVPILLMKSKDIIQGSTSRIFDFRIGQTKTVEYTLFSLLLICVAISVYRILMTAFQFFSLIQLKKSSVSVVGIWANEFEFLKDEMGIRRKTLFFTNENLSSPIAAGFMNPAVILPESLLDENEGEKILGMLRHELAHVQRYDDWTNLIQQCITAVLFFHPVIRWISDRLNIEREVACDDHVLAASLAPHDYAIVLTEFAGRRRNQHWLAAPAAWSSQSQLKQRIQMILDTKRNTSLRPARFSIGVLTASTIALTTAALVCGPRFVLAETPESNGVSTDRSSATAVSNSTSQGQGDFRSGSTGSDSVAWSEDKVRVKDKGEALVSTGKSKDKGEGVEREVTVLIDGKDGKEIIFESNYGKSRTILNAPPSVGWPDHISVLPPAVPGKPRPPKGMGENPAWLSKPRSPKDMEMERRLERLERMLQELVGDEEEEEEVFHNHEDLNTHSELEDHEPMIWKNTNRDFTWHGSLDSDFKDFSRELRIRPDFDVTVEIDEKKIQEQVESALRNAREEMERAHRKMEDANLKAELAMREKARVMERMEIEFNEQTKKEHLLAQRKAIEEQMQMMQKQLDDLNKHIQSVEKGVNTTQEVEKEVIY